MKNLQIKNKKRIALIALGILFIILCSLIALSESKNVSYYFTNVAKRLGIIKVDSLVSYTVYDNQDENKIKTLVNISNDDGIEYIIKPDNTVINVYGKKDINIDQVSKLNETVTYKVKPVNASESTSDIIITDETIENGFTSEHQPNITKSSSDGKYTTFETQCIPKNERDTITYSVANHPWYSYSGNENIILDIGDVEEIDPTDPSGKTGISTIYFKSTDPVGNAVTYSKKVTVDISNYLNTGYFDVFESLQRKNKNPNYYGIEISTMGESNYFSPYSLGFYHGNGGPWACSWTYTLDFEQIHINTTEKATVSIHQWIETRSSVSNTITITYTDNTTESKSYSISSGMYEGAKSQDVTAEFDLDTSKNIKSLSIYTYLEDGRMRRSCWFLH